MENKTTAEMQTCLNGQVPKDILDDLSSRFIINVPEEERKDVVRLCFQIELAHWFYLDFYCPEDPFLRPCGMRDFAKIIFNHIPSIKDHAKYVDNILDQWREYKMAVPSYGAILLDQTMENVLLVQSYFAKASWGFPKGKVNEEEESHRCAVREVLEETGFDIEKIINPNEFLEHYIGEQLIRLYLVSGVPKNFEFKPRTRNEIKGFKWFPVCSLPTSRKDLNCKQSTGFNPNAFFMVIPFVRNLRKWISTKIHKTRRLRSKTANELPTEYEIQQQQSHLQKQASGIIESSKFNKTSFSPPPRMLKNKLQKSYKGNDKPHLEAFQKQRNSHSERYDFSSSVWTNFKFDRKALMAAFD